MRTSTLPIACLVITLTVTLSARSGAASYSTFDFNDGTAQGWWLDGAYDENGNGPFSSFFTFSWWDMVTYPNIPFNDPAGDNNGSAMLFTSGGHGINNPAGTWWIMQLHSPDLSGSSTWQGATGYSVQLADAMSVWGTLYCNLYVRVYDHDQGTDRYFYNGTAQPMQHYQTQAWNYFSFDDWSAISGFPVNYTVKEVFVNIWGLMTGGIDGAVFLDEVVPVSNPRRCTSHQRGSTSGRRTPPWISTSATRGEALWSGTCSRTRRSPGSRRCRPRAAPTTLR